MRACAVAAGLFSISSYPAVAQLEFEEKERHFDTTFFDLFGLSVDIGPNVVVVARSGNGVPWTNDEPPHRTFLFEHDTTFIKSLSVPGFLGGTPIISANADADEVLVGGSPQAMFLLEKDTGGPDNWGVAASIGDNSGGALIVLDGDTVVARAQFPDEGLDIYERDEDGPGNWGLVTNASHIADNDLSAIDLDGDLLVVGEGGYDSNAGRAYVYERDAGGTDAWGLVATLDNPDVSPADDARFGGVVAVSGDTVAIGMTRAGEGDFLDPGSAWVFQHAAGDTENWGLVKRIEPTANPGLDIPNGRSRFGSALDLDGDNLIVGARGSANDQLDPEITNGRYFHFSRDQGGTDNWGQTGFYGANADPAARRGETVAIHGTKFVAGVPFNDRLESGGDPSEDITDSGSVDIGNVPSGSGVQVFPSSFVDRLLGRQIAASNDDLAIAGSAPDGNNTVLIKQQTYVGDVTNLGDPFPRLSFQSTQRLVPPFVLNQFGGALAMNDDGWLAVGDFTRQPDGGAAEEGIVVLFEKNTQGIQPWIERQTVRGLDPYSFTIGWFGHSVAMNDELLVVGAPYFPDDPVPPDGPDVFPQTGRVFVYAKDQGGIDNWGLVTELTADDGQSGDLFGWEVSLSGDGDTIAVSATSAEIELPGEINPIPDVGAVYIFDRNQGGPNNWGQVEKVIPDEVVSDFGISLQVDGDTLVVGADDEKAFVFERDEGGDNNWGQVDTLTDPLSGGLDGFGELVALQGDILTVTADSAATTSNGTGKVMVFRRDPSDPAAWVHVATLLASDSAPDGSLGDALFMKGDHIYVGARLATEEEAFEGKVYHFVLPPRVRSIAAFDGSEFTELDADNGPAEAPMGVTQLEVRFSQNVATFDEADPEPRPPEDVIMPGNYLLLRSGPNDNFDTPGCGVGVLGDDIEVTVDAVAYDQDSFIATLDVNGGAGLPAGGYRFNVCGSTSIISYWEEKLDGDADLAGGDDYALEFKVAPEGLFCFPVDTPSGASLICL